MNNHQIEDEYEHLDNDIEYLIECILQEDDGTDEFKDIQENFNSMLVNPCSCLNTDCGMSGCSCSKGGTYELIGNEIILAKNFPDFIIECSSACSCPIDCINRLVQLGPRKGLKIVNSKTISDNLGLITIEPIPKGAYICEYAGEILTKREAEQRNLYNEENNCPNYVLCLNEIKGLTSSEGLEKYPTFIDPSKKGNIGRYINHSHDPNLTIISVRIDCPIPKVTFFASRDILEGEELFFDYGAGNSCEFGSNSKACLCGSANCSGFLPSFLY